MGSETRIYCNLLVNRGAGMALVFASWYPNHVQTDPVRKFYQ